MSQTGEEDKKPSADQSAAHINLKVKGQDGNEVFFRIKRSMQLKKLMNAYCERQSVEIASISFLFDGRRLRAEQTPDELQMEDGDEIETGEEDKKPSAYQSAAHINLKVKGQDGNEVFFRMKRSLKLKNLMNVYCEHQSVEIASIAFLFDGRHLRAEQTPDELEMEDGDKIDAMLHQTGVRDERVLTFEDEGGFAGAARAVEDEGLKKARLLGVSVEDGFHQGSWKDPPWFRIHQEQGGGGLRRRRNVGVAAFSGY